MRGESDCDQMNAEGSVAMTVPSSSRAFRSGTQVASNPTVSFSCFMVATVDFAFCGTRTAKYSAVEIRGNSNPLATISLLKVTRSK